MSGIVRVENDKPIPYKRRLFRNQAINQILLRDHGITQDDAYQIFNEQFLASQAVYPILYHADSTSRASTGEAITLARFKQAFVVAPMGPQYIRSVNNWTSGMYIRPPIVASTVPLYNYAHAHAVYIYPVDMRRVIALLFPDSMSTGVPVVEIYQAVKYLSTNYPYSLLQFTTTGRLFGNIFSDSQNVCWGHINGGAAKAADLFDRAAIEDGLKRYLGSTFNLDLGTEYLSYPTAPCLVTKQYTFVGIALTEAHSSMVTIDNKTGDMTLAVYTRRDNETIYNFIDAFFNKPKEILQERLDGILGDLSVIENTDHCWKAHVTDVIHSMGHAVYLPAHDQHKKLLPFYDAVKNISVQTLFSKLPIRPSVIEEYVSSYKNISIPLLANAFIIANERMIPWIEKTGVPFAVNRVSTIFPGELDNAST